MRYGEGRCCSWVSGGSLVQSAGYVVVVWLEGKRGVGRGVCWKGKRVYVVGD